MINAIIGEGYDKPTEGKCLGGTTRDVTHYSIKVNGVQFNIWDSPGLQDITEEDDQIIEKITTKLKQECNDIHLFLYCLRMDTDRIQNGDKLAIKMLTDNCFGPKIWEVSVFALTYANKVSPPPEKDTDDLAPIYFKQRQEEYKQNIIEILKECKIDKKKASEIAVIPTGYHTVTRSTPNPYVLPDRDDWFNPFWIACADRMKTTALVPLISSQGDRMELVQQKSPEQQNSPEQQSRNAENPEVIKCILLVYFMNLL